MTREPLLTNATITALVTAVIGLVTAFGLDLSNVQVAAIMGVVAVVSPFVVTAFTRGKVTPVADPRL